MAQHQASVTVNAPLHQVYALFTHFNDYPKFMSYVHEVTYLDDQRSHWVVDVVGRHEWDAVNEDWIADRQIGWRSTSGVNNRGRITFDAPTPDTTVISATIEYEPPGGFVGQIGETLGGGAAFEARLQNDLRHFAAMVDEAPIGALDPNSSTYLFHPQSAVAQGRATEAQRQTMDDDSLRAEGERTAEAWAGGDVGPGSENLASDRLAEDPLTDPTWPDVPGTTPRELR